jgi:hypothetical protein
VQTRTITNTQVTNYTYDAANRLTNAGGVNYTWDNNPTPLRYGDFAATSRAMAGSANYLYPAKSAGPAVIVRIA